MFSDGKPYEGKLSRPVWSGGKDGVTTKSYLSLSYHLQAEDRIHRITQENECHIYYLYTEAAIEKIVVNSLQRKLDNISMIVDGEENKLYSGVAEELNAALDDELKSVQERLTL